MKTLIQILLIFLSLQVLYAQNPNLNDNHGNGNGNWENGNRGHGHVHGYGNRHNCIARCHGSNHFEIYFEQVWIPGTSVVNRWGRHWVAGHWDRIERFRPITYCDPLPPTPTCMNPYEFQGALRTIQNQHFDSSKLNVAKQVASAHFLSAQQVRMIMMCFSFESSRMAFAKFAWNSCIDKQNYYLVNDAFQFSSSIAELDRFIRCH